MRSIDADKLRREIQAQANPYGKPSIGYDDGLKVIQIIDRQITVDAEPVVRCKDCKHAETIYIRNRLRVYCCHYNTMESEIGYCYRGERRE